MPTTAPAHAPRYPSIYPQMLQGYGLSRGLNAQTLLAGTGVDPQTLQEPEGSITQSAYRQMVHNAVAALNEPGLGLQVGTQINLGAHGYVGYAAMSSPTVGHALRLGAQYYAIQGRPTEVRFIEQDGMAGFDFELTQAMHMPDFYRYVMEIAMATTLSALRFYFGGSLPAVAISLHYPAPAYAACYDQLLGVATQFNQPGNGIRFDAALLQHPLASANPVLAKMAQQHCQALLAAQTDRRADLPAQIEQMLLRQAGHFPTQNEVADKLHMSPRNLRLQLQKQHSSYQRILSKVRHDLSLHYLRNSEMTVDEIAYLLDYRDTPSFTRAFRKWTGQSPSGLRAGRTIGDCSP